MASSCRSNGPPNPFWAFISSLDGEDGPRQFRPRAENQNKPAEAEHDAQTEKKYKKPMVEDEAEAESSTQPATDKVEPAPRKCCGRHQKSFRVPCGPTEAPSHKRPHCGSPGGGCPRRPPGPSGPPGLTGCCKAHHHHCRPHPHPHPPPPSPRRGPPPYDDSAPNGRLRGPAADVLGNLFGTVDGGPSQDNRNNHLDPSKLLADLSSMFNTTDLAGGWRQNLHDLFNANLPEGVDFEPRTDVFETKEAYVAHLSLAGAKKQDLGVDWDGENSVLRVSGVVHRPGIDEETLKMLAVDGRKHEIGFFDKMVRLGTRRAPATVDVAGITAKMTDGVLVVKLPKIERHHQRREVSIGSASSASGTAPASDRGQDAPVSLQDQVTEKGKEVQTGDAMDVDDSPNNHLDQFDGDRSPTEAGDADIRDDEYQDPPDQLPEYVAHVPTNIQDADQDDHSNSSEADADYVKIDVR